MSVNRIQSKKSNYFEMKKETAWKRNKLKFWELSPHRENHDYSNQYMVAKCDKTGACTDIK